MPQPAADSEERPGVTATPTVLGLPLLQISANGLGDTPSDPSVRSERSDSPRDLAGLEAATGLDSAKSGHDWHLLPITLDGVVDAAVDLSVPAERSHRDSQGLTAAKIGSDRLPPYNSNIYHELRGVDDQIMRRLHLTLNSHRVELQSYLEDWSQRQNHIFDSFLSGQEYATLPRGNAFNVVRKHEKADTQLSTDIPTGNGTFIFRNDENQKSAEDSHTLAPAYKQMCPAGSEAPRGSSASAGVMSTAWTWGNSNPSGKASVMTKLRTTRIGQVWKQGLVNSLMGEGTRRLLYAPKRTRARHLSTRNSRLISCYQWANQKYKDGKDFMADKTKQGILARFVLSNAFEGLCATIILANSICLGYSSDYAIHNLEAPSTKAMDSLELAFTIFYTAELLLRMSVLGWAFLFTDDWKWNMFDLILVASAAWDQISWRLGNDSAGNTSVLRVMRLTKMMKLLRIFRILRMFRELRLILTSIIGSMRSMIWAITLIVIITYVIGIVFLQAGTVLLMDGTSNSTMAGIHKNWGSLADSMLSLYFASTGGVDWVEIARTLEPVGTAYYMLFLLYIAFFLFVVMNTLTSLFVETAMKNAEHDQQMVIQDELKRKNEHINKIRKLYEKISQGSGEELTRADFDKVLHDHEMLAFMQSVEIDTMDVEQFFNILSCDGTQGVDIETFVVGCMKLRGMARSMDLLGLIHTQRQDSLRIKQIETQLKGVKDLMKTRLPRQDSKGFQIGGSTRSFSSPTVGNSSGSFGREALASIPARAGAEAFARI